MRVIARLAPIAVLAACATDPADSAAPALGETSQEAGSVCATHANPLFGIDVSRFQGTIDWQQVKDANVVYAWIQISRSLTDIDLKFPYNWKRAKEVGILRGAYQRFHPGQDVPGQANLFLDKLGPYQTGDLPPMLDVEDADGLPAATIAARVKEWMDIVEPALGVKPIIYTGFYFWRDSVGSADLSDHPLWVANYSATCPLVPDHWTKWTFHQYSSTINLPGIPENTVDVDRFDGTLDDLKALGKQPTCGDGTCNGDETPDTCAAECKPCQTITDTRITGGNIVDNNSACFTIGGDAAGVRTENAGYDSTLRWTYATDAAQPESSVQWNLHFAEAGRYRVEAFTPAPYNQSKLAVYEVTHSGTTSKITVDQSAVDGWNPIGEFDFVEGGHEQAVRIADNTGEPLSQNVQIVFDALRFTRIGDGGDPGGGSDGDDAAPPSNDLGCSTGGGAGCFAGLVLLALRRRKGTVSTLSTFGAVRPKG